MPVQKIERAPSDETFRNRVKESLDAASREIMVISGELGAYEFPELKEAALRALARKVKVRIYAVRPPPDAVQELRESGAEFHLGTRYTDDHYLVIDKKTLIVSKKEKAKKRPTTVGERQGYFYKDEIKKVKAVENFFTELTIVETIESKRKENLLLNFAYYIFRIFVPGFTKVKEPKIVPQ
jgi:23S rRNA-/tRNA-specific pseudouridylate synthase